MGLEDVFDPGTIVWSLLFAGEFYLVNLVLGGSLVQFGTWAVPLVAGLAFLLDHATNLSLNVSAMIIKPR